MSVQNEVAFRAALDSYAQGFDFADALHHVSYSGCESVGTFDDKGFARKANKRAILPRMSMPR